MLPRPEVTSEATGVYAAEDQPAWVRFYGAVVGQAELLKASKIEGLDGEIAVLRMKLAEHRKEHPDDLAFMLRCVEVIARMVGARYRMSAERTDELLGNVAAVVKSIADQLNDERVDDV